MAKRIVAGAHARSADLSSDVAYQACRALMLKPVPVDDPEASSWTGPVPMWISQAVVEDYKARGVFSMLHDAPLVRQGSRAPRASFSVSAQFARQVIADAFEQRNYRMGRNRVHKWAMLASRLEAEVCRIERVGARSPAAAQRTGAVKRIEDYTDSDLLSLLRAAMIRQGVEPLSVADNIHAHLVARTARRERQ